MCPCLQKMYRNNKRTRHQHRENSTPPPPPTPSQAPNDQNQLFGMMRDMMGMMQTTQQQIQAQQQVVMQQQQQLLQHIQNAPRAEVPAVPRAEQNRPIKLPEFTKLVHDFYGNRSNPMDA